MKKYISLVIFSTSFFAFSQKIVIPMGYVYNQKHNIHLGVDTQLTQETFWIIGVSSNTTFYEGKLKSIPEIHTSIIPF